MTGSKWHEGHLVGLDTETTGTDPLTDRIVTAAIVHRIVGNRPRPIQWVIDPGMPVPDEAAAVHGWTNDRIRSALNGAPAIRITNQRTVAMTRDGALNEIAAQCGTAIGAGVPLVVHNAAFDLTLLEAELARNDIDTLSSRPCGITGVVDPMVIEKQYDPYRKVCYKQPGCNVLEKRHECGGCRGGKHKCGGCGATDKTLGNLCRHYGVVHAGAHDAAADVVAALRLVPKLAAAWPAIASWKLATLHKNQVDWRRQQSDGLRDFWRRQGDERWREVDSGWPLQSTAQPAPVGVA